MKRFFACSLAVALLGSVSLMAWAQAESKLKLPMPKDEKKSDVKESVFKKEEGKAPAITLVAGELVKPVVLSRQETALLKLLNKHRTEHGLEALPLSHALVRAARTNATEMALKSEVDREVGKKNVAKIVEVAFTAGPGGVAPAIPGGPAPTTTKLVAWTEGYYPLEGVIDVWKENKESRERLLTRGVKEVGVGIVRTTRNEFYYTILYLGGEKGK
jgi:uncharacterized protein YkwD